MYICVVTSRVVPATRKETLRRVAARPPVDGARRSTGSLALLELDGVHGDVAPDQHDGSAGGAEHRGAALGLSVAGEKGVSQVSFRSSRSKNKEKKTSASGEPISRSRLRSGGDTRRWRGRGVRTAPMSYIFSAWMYACGGEGGAGGKGQRRDARREQGNPSKISPANGRAEPREASGGARAHTGSPSPPRMGAEVLKLRTGAVRARCVSARRAALTRALDMLPRAAKSGVRMQAVHWRANLWSLA